MSSTFDSLALSSAYELATEALQTRNWRELALIATNVANSLDASNDVILGDGSAFKPINVLDGDVVKNINVLDSDVVKNIDVLGGDVVKNINVLGGSAFKNIDVLGGDVIKNIDVHGGNVSNMNQWNIFDVKNVMTERFKSADVVSFQVAYDDMDEGALGSKTNPGSYVSLTDDLGMRLLDPTSVVISEPVIKIKDFGGATQTFSSKDTSGFTRQELVEIATDMFNQFKKSRQLKKGKSQRSAADDKKTWTCTIDDCAEPLLHSLKYDYSTNTWELELDS